MRILDLQTNLRDGWQRASATVIWETAQRPPLELYYEVPEALADQLDANPNAFAVAAVLPALRHGERRLAIEGSLCPVLQHGIATAIKLQGYWCNTPGQWLELEPAQGFVAAHPRADAQAGCFFSGGIDSMATLCRNRLCIPRDHPAAIRRAMLVHGFDLAGKQDDDPRLGVFDDAIHRLEQVAREADATLLPVRTNARHLDDDLHFWSVQFHGAALCSVAHALGRDMRTVYVASTFQIQHQEPWGTHPMLDPCWSSAALRCVHEGADLYREQKVELVASWPAALNHIRVCLNPNFPRGELNCGLCEKCIRTMLCLVWCGKLQDSCAFPQRELTAQRLATIRFKHHYQPVLYGRMIPRLRAIGRDDLADVILERTADYHAYTYWAEERGWRGKARQLDRRYLGGALTRVIRRIR